MREYTEEFYKVNLRAGYVEESTKKIARYINGMPMEIQDEISMISPRTMEEAYQCALRVEEKLLRKQNFNRGRGSAKGRGQTARREKFAAQKGESRNSNHQEQQNRRNDSRQGRPYQGGRGRGRGKETVFRCYNCNKLGHRYFECSEKENIGKRGDYVSQNEQ